MTVQEIVITQEYEGQRLNKFLGRYLDGAPQSFIYKMLRKKNIKLNNKKATGNEMLSKGDSIKVFMTDETIKNFRKDGALPRLEGAISEDVTDFSEKLHSTPALDILYEDQDILVLNKPTDMLSQKSQPGDYTLNEMIVDYYKGKTKGNSIFTPSVCNRLDRNTSGVILAGMSLKGSRCLSVMLKERTLDKYYLTVVSGKVPEKESVKGYLTKLSTHNRVRIFSTEEESKKMGATKISYIETRYEPLAYGSWKNHSFTLLKVKLITGKTHQIRAHLHASGYPIIGDGKYGDKSVNQIMKKDFHLKHQLLHAYCIIFPEKVPELSKELEGKSIQAKPPKQFLDIVSGVFHIQS